MFGERARQQRVAMTHAMDNDTSGNAGQVMTVRDRCAGTGLRPHGQNQSLIGICLPFGFRQTFTGIRGAICPALSGLP